MARSVAKHVRRFVVPLVLSTPLALPHVQAYAAPVPTSCTRYVAAGTPTGDGTTAASPMSLTSLTTYVNAAPRPGLVACLAGGSYGSPTAQFTFTKGGAAGSPVAIVKNPTSSTEVVIAGRLVIARGADNVVLSGLQLVGPGPGTASAYTIDANNVTLVGNDISAPNRICISVGSGIRAAGATLPKASGFLADGNKVHDCGTNLVKTGSPQAHAFYLEYTSGAIVRNNIVRNPVGRAVQLFNDADGSLIENNIFDGNFAAVNFGGGTGGSASVDPRPENNVVQNNIVTNGIQWCNVNGQCQKALFVQGNHEAAYASPPSSDPLTKAGATWGNVVRSNCVYFTNTATQAVRNDWEPGYRYESSNLEIDPQYNNSAAGDFRLKSTSRCLGKGVRPGAQAVSTSAWASTITATAALRSPWMTATYRLQVRLCSTAITSTASTTPCTGAWTFSATASAVAIDSRVSRSVSGLLANRIYEYRWVTWQALQAAPATSLDYSVTTAYWTASAPLKVKTTA